MVIGFKNRTLQISSKKMKGSDRNGLYRFDYCTNQIYFSTYKVP